MSNKLAPLRGMKDLLPGDYNIFKYIENTAFNTAKLYGYEGFATPILESIAVFDRTLGETSDVVNKELYCFEDKKGRKVAMRPEFTAGIMRAYISNSMQHQLPLKLFSCGPIFRYDRPQEGRQRQFHQLNFEYLGAKTPYSDAETILTATHILQKLDIMQDLTLELNSLGCSESRDNYQAALIEYFEQHTNSLSEDSKKRLHKNPLRILDSKDKTDQEIAQNAPKIPDYYTKESAEYFGSVQKYLDNLGIKYTVNNKMVRGLDYYSHTAFEFTTTKLGAQSTVLAGGRYDGLAKLMGGPETPSIGFAAGIERIALMREYKIKTPPTIAVIPIGDECLLPAAKLAQELRNKNYICNIEHTGKVNKRIQNALDKNASHAIFIGSEELVNNNFKLKNLIQNTENTVSKEELLASIEKK